MGSTGSGRESEKNTNMVGVQYVVIFELKGRELDAAQKAFLEHLHSEDSGKVVISGAYYNDGGAYVKDLF